MTFAVPDLDAFDLDRAWDLGSSVARRCRAEGQPVTVVVWVGEQRVFHSALLGTSADNDHWAERKARIVRRFHRSSAEVHDTYASGEHGVSGFLTALG